VPNAPGAPCREHFPEALRQRNEPAPTVTSNPKMIDPAKLFAARVPRYTSYPTAPHFHAGIGEADYRAWLAGLPPGEPISLYVHIPFCDTLCWFCGCNTTVVNTYSPVSGYFDLLMREMDMVAEALSPGHPVTHLHFGGGSPTLLSPQDFLHLNRHLRGLFAIAPGAEIAIEIDPRGFTGDMAQALAEAGVTRASIGVQDCDPAVQKAINRIQPQEVTEDAVRLLRDAGIHALNIDLIYGLPHQTVAGLERTIGTVLELGPDRLAIFGYAHVPHFKKHMALIPESTLPVTAERMDQAQAAEAMLIASGYVPIGIDHFAKPGDSLAIARRLGRLSRNFQGYTTDSAPALIGLGASSIGALPQGYVQNFADVPSWRSTILRGALPVAKGIALSGQDRARRAVIERLMCDREVDVDAVAKNYGLEPGTFDAALKNLEEFRRDGLVSICEGKITIPPHWKAATRLVCAMFDTYLDPRIHKHAVAA